jgi:hypothetical protein
MHVTDRNHEVARRHARATDTVVAFGLAEE